MEQTSGKGRGRASERALRSWAGIVEMIGGRLKRLRSQAFWVRLSQPRAILHGLAVMVAWLHAMLLKLPLLVVIIVLATIVIQGLTQHATVIDPISVPRDLADSGYTAEVASHRLRDAVTDFMSGVNSRMSNPDIALHGDLPKIVVPAVGISLDAIVASIRTLMHGTRTRTVSGEIVAQDKLYWLRLRLDGREIYTSKTGVALNKPDELFAGAVPALLRQVKPYFVVVSLRRQDPEAALKMIDEIIPKLSANDEELPWYYNQRALVMRSRKDYAAAEQALTTALRLNPNLVVSHLNLGVIYSDQGKLDAAIAEDLQALKLDPNFAVAHDNYGSHLRKQRKFAEAKAELDRALALDRNYAVAHESLGELYRDTGREAEAIAAFQEALRLDPRLVTAKRELEKLTAAQAASAVVPVK